MRKNIFTIISIAILSLGSVFLIVNPVHAGCFDFEPADILNVWSTVFLGPIPLDCFLNLMGAEAKAVGEILLNIVAHLFALLRGAIAPIANTLIHIGLTQTQILLNSDIVYTIWTALRSLANAIFLFALLITSIFIIARINTGIYNIKKFLGGFITAVVLANFSYIVVRALLGLSQTLEQAVFSLGKQLPGMNEVLGNDIASVLGYITALLNTDMTRFGGGNKMIEIIILIIMSVLVLWVVAKLGLVLVERIIRLFILIVTAPVIFAASLLPNYQDAAKGWWSSLFKWILVLPFALALIIFSIFLIGAAGFPNAEALLAFNPPPGTDATKAGLLDFDIETLTLLILALYTLYLAGSVNTIMKIGSVTTGIIETPQKALGLVNKAIQPARVIAGGALNLAGSGIAAGGKGLVSTHGAATKLGKFGGFLQRFKGLGTQVGAIPETGKQFMGNIAKAQKGKTEAQAGVYASRLGSKISKIPGLSEAGDAQIQAETKNIVQDGNAWASNNQGAAATADALINFTNDGDEGSLYRMQFAIQKLISMRDTSPEDKAKYKQMVAALKTGDSDTIKDAFSELGATKTNKIGAGFGSKFADLNKRRQEILPVKMSQWDAPASESQKISDTMDILSDDSSYNEISSNTVLTPLAKTTLRNVDIDPDTINREVIDSYAKLNDNVLDALETNWSSIGNAIKNGNNQEARRLIKAAGVTDPKIANQLIEKSGKLSSTSARTQLSMARAVKANPKALDRTFSTYSGKTITKMDTVTKGNYKSTINATTGKTDKAGAHIGASVTKPDGTIDKAKNHTEAADVAILWLKELSTAKSNSLEPITDKTPLGNVLPDNYKQLLQTLRDLGVHTGSKDKLPFNKTVDLLNKVVLSNT